MSDYWEDSKRQPSFKEWLAMWHGCVLCNCDHGCNQWIVENAPKAYLLFEGLRQGQTAEFLDKIAQEHINVPHTQIWKRVWAKVENGEDVD
jgi:hypothetical protein